MRVLTKMLAYMLWGAIALPVLACVLVWLAICAVFALIGWLFNSVWGILALIVLGMAGAVWVGGLR